VLWPAVFNGVLTYDLPWRRAATVNKTKQLHEHQLGLYEHFILSAYLIQEQLASCQYRLCRDAPVHHTTCASLALECAHIPFPGLDDVDPE
jgi:hypothetical protein